MRRAGGVKEEVPVEGSKETLASRAEEGPEGPESGTEDPPEERVFGGALGAALTRTGEDAAMERRVRTAVVVAMAVDVVALEFWRKLCREGGESKG